MIVVSVNIFDKDNKTTWLRRQGSGGYEAVFRVDAMDPNYEVAKRYLGVDRPTFGISIESSSLEPENVNEESLRGLHVLVYSQRNDRLGSQYQNLLLSMELERGRVRLEEKSLRWEGAVRLERYEMLESPPSWNPASAVIEHYGEPALL